ncbi:hypothetical protein BN159_5994 [Streptomyces davaonensis JCM 4913]|uniref:Uncharacterized protein n=1 Tax=Streptomyces davaonensis (strain DSM 101723 / JCM 4913 / KCC S-0913 / 768) TaxID=1214101 RepID=K4RAH6_STRDJ|nr:hypothetical protein [Streptomyces davaonensis]CCK30373.1 hypothetical protein BN159_5994 [Streptomyces davaonensis JCM 4913]
MTARTETGSPQEPPNSSAFGRCAWHQGNAWGVRLIRTQDEGSAFGGSGLFACLPCRRAYDLTPLADR